MLVTCIDITTAADFIKVNGIAYFLEFGVIINPRAVAPLFFRHQQGVSHVLVGVFRTVTPETVAVCVDLPIHQISSAGIRHPLHGVFINTIESNFVRRQSRDQHPIPDALGHGVVGVLGALNAVAAIASTAALADTGVRHEFRAPIRVVGLHPSGRQGRRRGRRKTVVIKVARQVGICTMGERKRRCSAAVNSRRIGPRFQRCHRRQKEDYHPEKDGATIEYSLTHFGSLW
jgi:hypothetical protein